MDRIAVRKRRLERKTDWTLRIAYNDPFDKDAVKSFLERNIWKGKSGLSELYDWKYDRNPFGKTLMVVGERSTKDVVGFGVFMPWQLCCGAKVFGATQWVDLIVLFSYRGTGISSKILQDGIAEARAAGKSICFAFPNANSVPVHKKNNGFHLGHIVRYVKPLKIRYLVSRRIKNEKLASFVSKVADVILCLTSKEAFTAKTKQISAVEHCNSEFDTFWSRLIREYPTTIMTQKTSAYMNWKYLNTPQPRRAVYALKADGQMQGFVVLEEKEHTGYIIDIAAMDSKSLDQLIAFSINHFRILSKDSVVFVCLENNMFLKDFKSFGFLERQDKKHFYIYLDEKLEDRRYLEDARSWFITIGDCDIDSM